MNLKGYLGIVLAMAMMSETNFDKGNEPREFIPPKEPKKIIPKGCKEFKFRYGNNEFYECIATSQKSANRKFNSFLKTLNK